MNTFKQVFRGDNQEDTWMAVNFIKDSRRDIHLLFFEFTYPILSLKERIIQAWKVLTDDTPVMQSVTLTKEDTKKLRSFLRKAE